MQALAHAPSTQAARCRRVVDPLPVLTSIAILLAVAGVLFVSVEAMSAPLAGWARAQTLATLAPV
jgi:hypothetical protein